MASRLVLGLGNPGRRYADTRHNLGFRVVEEVARRRALSWSEERCNSRLACAPAGADEGLLLAQPQTLMNRSGYAARCLVECYGLATADLLVVYDEVALPLGRLRLRPGGSPAGHRGMESVIGELRTDAIARLRLGIAPERPPEDLVAFVLAPFPPAEAEVVEQMITRAAAACEVWLAEGAEVAMSRYNAGAGG